MPNVFDEIDSEKPTKKNVFDEVEEGSFAKPTQSVAPSIGLPGYPNLGPLDSLSDPLGGFAPVAAGDQRESVGELSKEAARRLVADPAISLLKGAVAVPEAAVGLADIVTGGGAGKALEAGGYGFQPKVANEFLEDLYSPEQKLENAAVQQAKGFLPTIEASIKNPSTIAHSIVESLPAMGGGAAVARKAITKFPKISALIGGALGEGVVGAGQAAEQSRQQNESGLLTPEQAALALSSGAITGLVGIFGGKVAKKFGVDDIDSLVAGATTSAERQSLAKQIAKSFVSEGVLEEMPQSALETIQSNIANGKPWNEGVAEAAAQGLVTGGVMGAGANVISGQKPNTVEADQNQATLDAAAAEFNKSREAEAKPQKQAAPEAMDFARSVADMPADEFREKGQAFNKQNIDLGLNASDDQLAELIQLRDKAKARSDAAMASNPQTDEDMQRVTTEMAMPQFYNEAIKIAEVIREANIDFDQQVFDPTGKKDLLQFTFKDDQGNRQGSFSIGRDELMDINKLSEKAKAVRASFDGDKGADFSFSEEPSDYDQYQSLVKKLGSATLEEKFSGVIQKQIEQIKNRHGGMPPKPASVDTKQKSANIPYGQNSNTAAGSEGSAIPADSRAEASFAFRAKGEGAKSSRPRTLSGKARKLVPGERGGRVTISHWSNVDLTKKKIDPKYHGKGIQGAERSRKSEYPNDFPARSYYGLSGYAPEQGLGPKRHDVEINADHLYDYKSDPDNLYEKAQDEAEKRYPRHFGERYDQAVNTLYERLISEAGYVGYYNPDFKIAAVFKALPGSGKADFSMAKSPARTAIDVLSGWPQKGIKPPQRVDFDLSADDKAEGASGYSKVFAVADHLSRRVAEAFGALRELTEENAKKIASAMASEVEYAVGKNSKAVGWYGSQMRSAMRSLIERHPDLDGDKGRQAVIRAMIAITSNGQDVHSNFARADELYSKWKQSGKVEVDGNWGGVNKNAINEGLKMLDSLIGVLGVENLPKFLSGKFTVGELRAAGLNITGEKSSHETFGSLVFGPKIGGGFYQNLSGNFDPVTMDRWFMRTFNRYRGTLTEASIAAIPRQIANLTSALKSVPGSTQLRADAKRILAAIKSGTFDPYAEADNPGPLLDFAKKKLIEYTANGFRDRSDINRASQRLAEEFFGMNEAPANASERDFIRNSVNKAQQILKGRGINLTNADLQAVLWYLEKEVYGKLGATSKRAEPASYADAAKSVGRKQRDLFEEPQRAGSVRAEQPAEAAHNRLGEVGKNLSPKKTLEAIKRRLLNRALRISQEQSTEESWAEKEPVTRESVQREIMDLSTDFPSAAPVVVVNTYQDLPDELHQLAYAQGGNPALIDGVLYDGKVYIVANMMNSLAEARATWLHEQAGHLATDKILGEKLDRFMQQVHDSFKDHELMNKLRKSYRNGSEIRLGREFIANLAENPTNDPNLWNKIVAMFRQFLRDIGLVKTVSENDIRVLLDSAMNKLMSQDTIVAGNATIFAPSLKMTAYHGTPHKIKDRFRTDRIGSGEGAQVYGWGLYFAQERETAKHYRDVLSEPEYWVDGEKISNEESNDDPIHIAIEKILLLGQDRAEAYAAKIAGIEGQSSGFWKNVLNQMAELRGKNIEQKAGNIYTVEINFDPEDTLDYEATSDDLSEQTYKALKGYADKYAYIDLDSGKDSDKYFIASTIRDFLQSRSQKAGDFYDRLGYQIEGNKAVSEFLSSLGIKGIRFADQGTRDKEGPKTYNYIVFDDGDITITQENGEVFKPEELIENPQRKEASFSFADQPELPGMTEEQKAQERKATQGRFFTGDYTATDREQQKKDAEKFIEYTPNSEVIDSIAQFASGKSVPGLSQQNVSATIAAVMKRMFSKIGTSKNPAEVAELWRLMDRAKSLAQQEGSVVAQTLEARKVFGEELGFMSPILAFRGLAQKAWAKAFGLPEGQNPETVFEGITKTATKEAGSGAVKKLVITNEKIRSILNKVAKEGGINWSELFLDESRATQKERREHLLAEIRKHPQLQDLTPEQSVILENALSKAWESARMDVFKREFSKRIKLPTVEAGEKLFKKVLPELIRQANLGTLDDSAFLNAFAKELGLPSLSGEAATKLTKLAQEAQEKPEGVLRNKILQQMIDVIQQTTPAHPLDIIRDYWYNNALSGSRTLTSILTGSWIHGAIMSAQQAMDAAILKGRPGVAGRILQAFLSDSLEGVANGWDVFRTGDYTRRAEFSGNINRMLSGQGRLDSLEGWLKHGNLWQKALGLTTFVRRAVVGLDYVGAIGTRGSGVIYNALLDSPEQLQAALSRFDKEKTAQAKKQAQSELGPDAKWVDVRARQLEILEAGISQQTRDNATVLGEIAALNAAPVGWGGIVYRLLEAVPRAIQTATGSSKPAAAFTAFAAKTAAGLAFARAAINMTQSASNWMPIVGGVNYARALLGKKIPEGHWSRVMGVLDSEGKPITDDRRRLIAAAQVSGLALAAIAYAMTRGGDDDEDKFDISGSWYGLTPSQRKDRIDAGQKPLSIRVGGRWYNYGNLPFAGALAMIGNMRDKERKDGKRMSPDEAMTRMVDAWASGLFFIKDISVLSGLSRTLGVSAMNTDESASALNRLVAQQAGNAAGMIPLSSALREIDTFFDPAVYKPTKGIDYWIRGIPYVRRYVGEGVEYNMAGLPVENMLTPQSRLVAAKAKRDPVVAALSSLISKGAFPHHPDISPTWIKNGQQLSAKDLPKETYEYQIQVLKRWREVMLTDADYIKSATPEEYEDYFREYLAPIRDQVKAEVQEKIDPEALDIKGKLRKEYKK